MAPALLPLLEEEERERWKKAIRSGSMRTLRFISQLNEIIEMLYNEGIEVITLKGPVLAQTLYGDLSQRHMRDLDLLVIHGDILKALELLQESGYILKTPGKELTVKQWHSYFKHQYDVALLHKEQGSILELHTRIAYPGLLGRSAYLITDQLETVEMAGRSMKCMSKEATFIYLAIHGAHHLFFRLFWLRDLAEAIKRWELDHTRILYMVRQMGIERMLGVGLRLTSYYFGTSIPAEYQPVLEENKAVLSRLVERCQHAILDPQFLTRRNRINVLLFSMALKPNLQHKWETFSSVYHRWYIRKFLGGH